MYQVISPSTDEDFESYYQLRWLLLRKPWDQPQGSEKDEYDTHAIHCMIVDDDKQPIAIGRLHVTSVEEGQIRYMAVTKEHRGKSLGTLIMMALEEEARKQGLKRLMLNSREGSTVFYTKCGYLITGDAPTLFGSVSHQQMMKNIAETDVIIRDAQWCQQLQQTWHDTIPISQVMGIRIHQYTGRIFETRAALNPNLNLHGTMFAGSVYSLATLTGWGLLHLWLKDQGHKGHIVLGDGNIHYHKPVSQQPGAIARMDDIEGDLSPLAEGKKARLKVKVEVRDGDKAVAQFNGLYVILPHE
jgi:thioesterase domain-containing protein